MQLPRAPEAADRCPAGGNLACRRPVTFVHTDREISMSADPKTGAGPKAPTERPDPDIAARKPEAGAKDRPGFDLGGAEDRDQGGGMADPKGSAAEGPAGLGRARGVSDPSGSRSLGDAGDAGSATGSGVTDGSGGPS
jgi:hypothetical protein